MYYVYQNTLTDAPAAAFGLELLLVRSTMHCARL